MLAAVLAAPLDDAPRLACAERLEALGDGPRAELIRRQCAYAALPEQSAERAASWPAIAALLEAHAAGWLADVASVTSARSLWRGLIESASGTMAELVKHAAALEREAPLSVLSLDSDDEDAASGTEQEAAFAPFLELRVLERVRTLQLQEAWTVAAAARLLASPRLQELASFSIFDGSGFPEAVGALCAAIRPALRTLSLIGFMTTDFNDRAAAVLAGASNLAALEHLRLWNCNLGPEGARALAASPHLGRVRSLWLGLGQYTLNKLGPEGGAALASPTAFPQLDTLDLDFNKVGDAGWLPMVQSGKLARFLELRLQACSLTDASVVDMCSGATRLDALATLDLSHNQLSAATARALAAAHPSALHTLWLYDNPLGDDGVAALVAAPWCAQLRELNLQAVGMTDLGVEALVRSPHLDGVRRLACELQRPGLSAAAVAKLKEHFGPRLWKPSISNLRAS